MREYELLTDLRRATACVLILLFVLLADAGIRIQDPERERFAAAGLREREVEHFFTAFKTAIAKDDKKTVATLISYPVMAILASGHPKKIRSRAEFIQAYDRIFDSDFKQLIAGTKIIDLWGKSAGVAMHRGEVWFAGVERGRRRPGYDIKIIAINGPIRD